MWRSAFRNLSLQPADSGQLGFVIRINANLRFSFCDFKLIQFLPFHGVGQADMFRAGWQKVQQIQLYRRITRARHRYAARWNLLF